jgi:septal ring factor EnvC (AmiA/AmiB activator)
MALQVKRPIFDIDDEAATVSAVVDDVKSEIDEVLRSRKAQPALASKADPSDGISLILKTMESSVAEIDRAIRKLQEMRKELEEEAARVQRELTTYASTSQAALGSLKAIGESLAKWQQPASTTST